MLDDADLDAAVAGATFGAFANSGQICMSTERFVVDNKVADAFIAKLAARAQSLPLGDPARVLWCWAPWSIWPPWSAATP